MEREMGRFLQPGIGLGLLLAMSGSSYLGTAKPIRFQSVPVFASPHIGSILASSKRFRFVAGWTLSSPSEQFGGLSAVVVDGADLLAVSDKGALVLLKQATLGAPTRAIIRPLPKGCGNPEYKADRDSESIARDPQNGDIWIGLEWRNFICRADASFDRAAVKANPFQMKNWPLRAGAESMTRLRDGRTIVLAERPPGGGGDSPLLVYPGDPTSDGATAIEMRYRPPTGYRPTDMAELPDRSLLIVHRRFTPPFAFSTIISMTAPFEARAGGKIVARPLALMKSPGVSDNFEGVAVEQIASHTYIWIVSDNNFVPLQNTYLLKFELMSVLGGSRAR
jgi:hypothetical protein